MIYIHFLLDQIKCQILNTLDDLKYIKQCHYKEYKIAGVSETIINDITGEVIQL